MKKIKELFRDTCCFSILILTLFYIFATVSKLTDARIGFSMFALILGFGCLISLAGEVLRIEKLAIPLRILIHYAILLVSFCIIFIVSGNISGSGAAAVFSAVAIFTFLYVILFCFVYFVKKGISKIERNNEKKNDTGKKSAYKPLYRSDDKK